MKRNITHTKIIFITVDSDDDQYADKHVDEAAERGKETRRLVLCMREP